METTCLVVFHVVLFCLIAGGGRKERATLHERHGCDKRTASAVPMRALVEVQAVVTYDYLPPIY